MYRIYKTLEKYNEYTENGQKLTSGDLYIVTDDKKVILQTNDIDGEFAVYDMIEPTGNIEITENGEDIDVSQYASATVNVPQPSGNISITENGEEIDIAQYASATVNVAGSGGNPLFSQFIDRSLTSIEIPEGTTSIGDAAFRYCTGLTEFTIPNGITSIGSSAFDNCTGLTSITVETATPPTLSNTNAFDNTNNCPIYVPAASVSAYKAATNWSSLSSRIQAIPA